MSSFRYFGLWLLLFLRLRVVSLYFSPFFFFFFFFFFFSFHLLSGFPFVLVVGPDSRCFYRLFQIRFSRYGNVPWGVPCSLFCFVFLTVYCFSAFVICSFVLSRSH